MGYGSNILTPTKCVTVNARSTTRRLQGCRALGALRRAGGWGQSRIVERRGTVDFRGWKSNVVDGKIHCL